jgi:sphingomyelin phosphodiesterase acid-like 3
MKRTRVSRIVCGVAGKCAIAVSVFLQVVCLAAQPAEGARGTARVLMVSDIHFEPFFDPGKVARLKAAPVSEWKGILAAPASADRAARFAALQQSCHAKGVDTSYALLTSSLRAMRADAEGAKFATLSGDLMAHDFSCKYATLFPKATAESYREFAEKTIEFVMAELRGAFPGVPVYASLGNNDSGCEDYKLDPDGAFLADLARAMTADVPDAERTQALKDFAAGGYYSVSLPAPVEHSRLVVLDDLFMSKKYSTCGGKPDPEAAAAQIAWLKEQLEGARRDGEHVWVMSHIPPGVDPYSTISKFRNVCGGQEPTMFLSSGALPEAMAGFGDVIQLAIFAHTHMDELRLLPGAKPGERGVALKMVPSISPVDGNNPSFVVARVNPATAVMTDYRVIAASNKTGVGTEWSDEYDFDKTYGVDAFSAETLGKLIAGFKADPGAKTEASESYLRNYFVGDMSRAIKPFWGEYVCGLGNDTAEGFRGCMCGGGK